MRRCGGRSGNQGRLEQNSPMSQCYGTVRMWHCGRLTPDQPRDLRFTPWRWKGLKEADRDRSSCLGANILAFRPVKHAEPANVTYSPEGYNSASAKPNARCLGRCVRLATGQFSILNSDWWHFSNPFDNPIISATSQSLMGLRSPSCARNLDLLVCHPSMRAPI